jgi:hypothetical protein
MKTEKILEEIKKVQFDDISHYEDFEFLSDEDYGQLEEVSCVATNPRRDYVGHEYVLLNKDDGKYFLVEFYGNDMGHEISEFCEVEKMIEVKEVVTYKAIIQ